MVLRDRINLKIFLLMGIILFVLGFGVCEIEFYAEFLGDNVGGETLFNESLNETKYIFGENAVLDINGTPYMYVEANTNSYILIDENGTIKELNLTASERTTWKIDGKEFQVEKGTRVEYFNGEIKIIPSEESGEFKLKNDFGEQLIKFGTESEVSIIGNKISGKNIQIGDIELVSGEAEMTIEGLLLNEGSEAVKDKVRINCERNDLLISNVENPVWSNFVSMNKDERYLFSAGDNFSLNFEEGNPYALIKDDFTKFSVSAGEGFRFNIQDRTEEELIPLVNLDGDFEMRQDGRTIKNFDNNMIISRAEIIIKSEKEIIDTPYSGPGYLSSSEMFSTPMEFVYSETPNKKYLINHLRGFAVLDLTENEGYSDAFLDQERRHFQKVSSNLKYNYPNRELAEKIMGIPIECQEELENDPELWGRVISYYEHLEDNRKNLISELNIIPSYNMLLGKVGGSYNFDNNILKMSIDGTSKRYIQLLEGEKIIRRDPNSESLYIDYVDYINSDSFLDFTTFNHELAHAFDDFLSEVENVSYTQTVFKKSWNKIVEEFIQEKIEEDTPFSKRFNSVAYNTYTKDEKIKIFSHELGFTRAYGATKPEEDVATYVESIKGAATKYFLDVDPLILKTIAQDKINLLLDYGFITQDEWDYLDQISFGTLTKREKFEDGEITIEEWEDFKEEIEIKLWEKNKQ